MSKSRNKVCICVKISLSVTNVIEEVIQQVRKQEEGNSQHEHHERSRPQNDAFEAKSI